MSAPLADRQVEIGAIDDLLDSVMAGAGGLLWIEGAPGLGKSRLIAEAVGRGEDRQFAILRCRARELERDYPFGLVLQLFEPFLARCPPAERDSLLSGAAALAASLVGGSARADDLRPAGSDFALLHGLYWLTVNIAADRPVLICVDDLQWSDEASTRFLLYLAERLSGMAVGLVVAGRPSGPGQGDLWLSGFRLDPAVSRVVLRPLPADGVNDVVRHFYASADDEFCMACAEVTGGNAFRVHEVLREVEARRISPQAGSSEMLRELGASTLGRAALFRLVRLGPAARAVAEAVATLGDGARLRWVAALAGQDMETTSRAVDALALEGILEAGEPLSFAHPLIRECVENDTPPARRLMSHRRAAEALAAEQVLPELVAGQLLEAPGAGEPWAVEMLRQSGRRARARGAPDAAVRYLQRALDEPPQADMLPGVLVELGAAEVVIGSDAAVAHLRSAHERGADLLSRADTARWLSRALAQADRAEEASDLIEATLGELGEDFPEASIELLGDWLVSATLQPRLRKVAAARVDGLVGALPIGSEAARRSLNAAFALRSAQRPDPVDQTVELVERAWQDGSMLASEGPDGPGWTVIVWALLLSEQYRRAERVLSCVVDAAREAGSATAFAAATFLRGFSCWRRGDLIEAQADAEQCWRASNPQVGQITGVLAALIFLERGDIGSAEAALSTVTDHDARWMPSHAFRIYADGRLALARGRVEPALELFLQVGEFLRAHLGAEHTVIPWRLDAARAAVALGDRDQARYLLGPLTALAERGRLSVMEANRLALLGLVEGGAEGVDLMRRGAAGLAHTPADLDHACVLVDLGAALRRGGHRSESRGVLSEAVRKARQLGASALAARADEELAAAGGRPRREAVTGVASLTPSEQRVGRMA